MVRDRSIVAALRRSRPAGTPPEAVRVAVVGGGASGVVSALHLLRAATPDRPVEVTLVERERTVGPGLAYRHGWSVPGPRHTLNNYAGRLSAVAGDPDHLVRWCREQGHDVGPTDFLPRTLYGAYLASLLDDVDVPDGSALGRVRGTARDVERGARGLEVRLTGGWSVAADAVVLALGNPPPRPLAPWSSHPGYVADPWARDLAERVGDAAEVMLLGSGLTAVDVVTLLHDSHPMSRFTLVSRHGLLPAAHHPAPGATRDTVEVDAAPLAELVPQVRALLDPASAAGDDWRGTVDTLRASANRLWRGLDETDQAAFVSTWSRRWEVARHRMPPEQAAFVERLRRSGRLVVRRAADVDPARFDRVVNCSGPGPVTMRGWNPLVDALLERGTIRPHRLGLGVDLDPTGRVVDGDGTVTPDVFAVGPARRGLDWEVTAVPDLREQALALAGEILPAVQQPDRGALPA